jgi:hypothetical protein
MESLLLDGVDRHLRTTKQAGIVERADFQNDGRHDCGPRKQMRAAFGAEFPRHGFSRLLRANRLGVPLI